jgi:hypothetical protein
LDQQEEQPMSVKYYRRDEGGKAKHKVPSKEGNKIVFVPITRVIAVSTSKYTGEALREIRKNHR